MGQKPGGWTKTDRKTAIISMTGHAGRMATGSNTEHRSLLARSHWGWGKQTQVFRDSRLAVSAAAQHLRAWQGFCDAKRQLPADGMVDQQFVTVAEPDVLIGCCEGVWRGETEALCNQLIQYTHKYGLLTRPEGQRGLDCFQDNTRCLSYFWTDMWRNMENFLSIHLISWWKHSGVRAEGAH